MGIFFPSRIPHPDPGDEKKHRIPEPQHIFLSMHSNDGRVYLVSVHNLPNLTEQNSVSPTKTKKFVGTAPGGPGPRRQRPRPAGTPAAQRSYPADLRRPAPAGFDPAAARAKNAGKTENYSCRFLATFLPAYGYRYGS